ncbi:MAG TPA: hypothetical protein VF407_16470 [Polyangiaceae bacterium]
MTWKPRKIGSIRPPGPSLPAGPDDPTMTQVTVTGPSVTAKK